MFLEAERGSTVAASMVYWGTSRGPGTAVAKPVFISATFNNSDWWLAL